MLLYVGLFLATLFQLTFALPNVNFPEKIRYDNYSVHRVTVPNKESLYSLKDLLDKQNLDVWGINKDSIDVLVPPHFKQDFAYSATERSEILFENLQKLIDKEEVATDDEPFGWRKYHTLKQINRWLDTLAAKYPHVKIVTGGKTYEGRPIKGVYISHSKANKNKAIFIEANIHAREWISSAVATYILNALLSSKDPAIQRIAKSYDWYIFPVFNPDGFAFSHTGDRMHRKTRVPYGGKCFGADPNRNWDFYWNTVGTSNDPCHQTYAGAKAFSEPMTQSMSQYIRTIGKQLIGYISFHSFSQWLLIPYALNASHVENYDQLHSIGTKAIKKLSERYGTKYDVANAVEAGLGPVSGSSCDWVKSTFHTPLTFTYELRDHGRYGFLLPAYQIIPTSEETLDSFVEIISQYEKSIR